MPNCAPVMEYVAIPEGSSSAAPVMTPGPNAARMRRGVETLREAFEGADILLRVVSALGYANSEFLAAYQTHQLYWVLHIARQFAEWKFDAVSFSVGKRQSVEDR